MEMPKPDIVPRIEAINVIPPIAAPVKIMSSISPSYTRQKCYGQTATSDSSGPKIFPVFF
jgi:hypothetical protein